MSMSPEEIESEDNGGTAVIGDAAAGQPEAPRGRSPIWMQFPRRVILLLASFAVALFLLRSAAAAPVPTPEPFAPVNELVLERLPWTVLLLASALLLATLLALIVTAAGMLAHSLEDRSGWPGALAKVVGRLLLFSWAPAPVAVLAMVLVLLLVLGPFSAPAPLFGAGEENRLFPLLLAALVLTPYPALLAAQEAVFVLTETYHSLGRWRRLLAALLSLLGSLLMQTGGLLSALIVVESVFAQPGLGRLLLDSTFRLDLPVMVGVLTVFALLILAARLGGELFSAVTRLLLRDGRKAATAGAGSSRGRRLWTILAALFLLLPLSLALLGLATPEGAVMQQDVQQRLAPPSPAHLLGTDSLGRDIWARVRAGSLNTLSRASLAAGLLLLPAVALGMLTGTLAERGGWLQESLADLILFPLDVLLFFPTVAAAMVALALARQTGAVTSFVVVAIFLLPRAVRAGKGLWAKRPGAGGLRDGLATVGALSLGAFFVAFVVHFSLEYLGFGPQPPTPTLGQALQEMQPHLRNSPQAAAAVSVLVALCAFALFSVAETLVNIFHTRKPLANLNE